MADITVAARSDADRMKFTSQYGILERRGQAQKVLEAIDSVDRHVVGEERNDIPMIMKSVAEPPVFVVKPQGQYQILRDLDSIRAYYDWTREDAFEVVQTIPIKQIATDWYLFWEQVPTVRQMETSGSVRAFGGPIEFHGVAFFPSSKAGVLEMPGGGDPAYERSVWAGNPRLPSDPDVERRNILAHARHLRSMSEGDVDGAMEGFVDDCTWFIRDYTTDDPIASARDRNQAHALLRDFHALYAVDGVAMLNRVSTNWYLFSEQLFQVTARRATPEGHAAGTRLQFRTAGVVGVNGEGRFTGQMGYGTAPEPL